MRKIYIENKFKLRFPGRSEEFDDGVEMGLLIADLSAKAPKVTRCLHTNNLKQAEDLACALGYHMLLGLADEQWVVVTFKRGKPRTKLTLVKG